MEGSARFGADNLRDRRSHDSVEQRGTYVRRWYFSGTGILALRNLDGELLYVVKLWIAYEKIMGNRIGRLLSFAVVAS